MAERSLQDPVLMENIRRGLQLLLSPVQSITSAMDGDADALLGSFMQEVEALSGPNSQIVTEPGIAKGCATGESEDRSQSPTAVRKTIAVAPPAVKTVAAAPPSHVSKTVAAAPPSHAARPITSVSHATSSSSHAHTGRWGVKRARDNDSAAGASSQQGPVAGEGAGATLVPQPQGKRPRSGARHIRAGGGAIWEDKSLDQWPDNDHRIFVGDLSNEVNDAQLMQAFQTYASCQMARVIRDKGTGKSKGFGFVSFGDPYDMAKALREMNGKYVGNRPVKLRKSNWQTRNIDQVRKKARKQKKLQNLLGGGF